MKQILSILFFTILAFQLSAQKFYLGVQAGYGLSTKSGQADFVNIVRVPDNSTTEKIRGGYGEGFTLGAKLGYNLNQHIGFELNSNYLFGRELTKETKETFDDGSGSSFYLYRIDSYQSTQLQLSPQIVFNTEINPKLSLYAKTGLTVGLFTNVKRDLEYTAFNIFAFIIKTNMERTHKGNIPIGFNAAFGINHKINENVFFYTEAHFLSMNYSPKKVVTTQYFLDNVDSIEQLTTRQKEQIYSDTINSNTPVNNDTPANFLSILMPMSNAGLNFGLKINL